MTRLAEKTARHMLSSTAVVYPQQGLKLAHFPRKWSGFLDNLSAKRVALKICPPSVLQLHVEYLTSYLRVKFQALFFNITLENR